jgi:putative tricarboxylic transport membrane protein
MREETPAAVREQLSAGAREGRTGQIAVGVIVILFGAGVLWAAADLPVQAGYAGIGPGALPRIVGAVLLILGAMLTWQAWRRGFDGVDEAAEHELGFDRRSFFWVSAGLIVYGVLVERASFIVASTLLFALTARGFGSRRWLHDGLIGLALAVIVYLLFSVGLKIQLPVGPFEFLRP